jgi:hypothetical protein
MGLKYIFSPLNIIAHIYPNLSKLIQTMATAWIKHVAAFRKAHPGMDPKKVFGEAAKTFKKQSTKHSGGSALGGDLSPEAVSGLPISSGTNLQMTATQYSGGAKKRSAKRSGKKRSTKRSGKKTRRH